MKKRWRDEIESDIRWAGVCKEDIGDRVTRKCKKGGQPQIVEKESEVDDEEDIKKLITKNLKI